jgi:hypothetical protein
MLSCAATAAVTIRQNIRTKQTARAHLRVRAYPWVLGDLPDGDPPTADPRPVVRWTGGGGRDHFDRCCGQRSTVVAASVWANSAKSQSRIIRRRVLFVMSKLRAKLKTFGVDGHSTSYCVFRLPPATRRCRVPWRTYSDRALRVGRRDHTVPRTEFEVALALPIRHDGVL